MTVSMSSATTSVAMTVALVEGKTHAENETIGAIDPSHLSKGLSYLKQKCTQLPTPFSGTVSNALTLGVIRFVQSVSLRNHFLVG